MCVCVCVCVCILQFKMKEWFCQTIRDNSLKAMEFTSLGSTSTD